jgi:hypothetical protein
MKYLALSRQEYRRLNGQIMNHCNTQKRYTRHVEVERETKRERRRQREKERRGGNKRERYEKRKT